MQVYINIHVCACQRPEANLGCYHSSGTAHTHVIFCLGTRSLIGLHLTNYAKLNGSIFWQPWNINTQLNTTQHNITQHKNENTTKQKLDERIDCLFNKQKMKKEKELEELELIKKEKKKEKEDRQKELGNS